MRIAVSAGGPTLDAEVDPRFGRCPYFVLIDAETGEWEAIENGNAASAGGAGIRTAQDIIERGIGAVITGNCGPNAYQTLSAAGIELVTGASGQVGNAIEAFGEGTLATTSGANVAAHYGTGGGTGRGMGMGMGARAGGGLGRARAGEAAPSGATDPLTELAGQLQALTQQIEKLHRRLDEVERRGE